MCAYGERVARSPLALAALATVAVPGLDAYDVHRGPSSGGSLDTAVVIDAQHHRWVVRAPRTAAAGAALEAEVALLARLAEHVDGGRLPFEVPRPAGFAPLPEGGRAVVHPDLAGHPLQLELLGPGPGLAAGLGRAIAALHELPPSTVEDAGFPVYEADAYRRRRLAEVDEAARTGKVPAALLRRWERALEDVAMWRFRPTVVHGDLSADHVLCTGDEPTALLEWTEAKVADPADDLAWLLVAAPQEAVDPILEAYALRRTELTDHHLAERALLAGELALARWLLHGVRNDDAEVVDDATAMLVELDEHTADDEPPPAYVGGYEPAGTTRYDDDRWHEDDVDDDAVTQDVPVREDGAEGTAPDEATTPDEGSTTDQVVEPGEDAALDDERDQGTPREDHGSSAVRG
nr:phosphotransferase [Cellulomonas sp. APG4]